MEKDKKFKASEYITSYQKEHYITFKVNLKKEDSDKLDDFLKKKHLTKAEFLRNTINNLKERGEINMKINELNKLNELNTKAGLLLNHRIDNKFYDFYMTKDLEWLIENEEKIESDYKNNIDKLKFDIILNTNLVDREELIYDLANKSIEEFANYINYKPFAILPEASKDEIEEKFKKFKSFKMTYDRVCYFDKISR